MKQLIVNADDFGFTRDVNAGIVEAHRSGILTSTTLMANGDAFNDAVRLARDTPTLDIGCHLVLIQGRALTTGQRFPDTPAQVVWRILRGGFDVYAELRAQIEKIIAGGIRPSHLDSHKHAHVVPGVFRAVVRLAAEFQIPFVRMPLAFNPLYRRYALRRGVHMTDHFTGYQLTGTLTEQTLAAALARLKEGITEFMCHPGYFGEDLRQAPTRLKESRLRELEALTSPRVRRAMDEAGARLATFDTVVLPDPKLPSR